MSFRFQLALAAMLAVGGFACSSKGAFGGDAPAVDRPFQSAPPGVYVAKVKNVLVGLAATDDEVRSVEADPAALGSLVDDWMRLPQYQQKASRFFELAFQQSQVTSNDFTDQVFAQIGLNDSTTPLILQNAQQSFARTVVELVSEGQPLTEAMTTERLMMTTAMKELYAFLDVMEVNNDGNLFDRFRQNNRTLSIVVEASQGPIPIAETLDPSSPNYMHWYDPDLITEESIPECQGDPVTLGSSALALHYLLLGSLDGRKLATGAFCPGFGGTPRAPQFMAGDFGDWTMVTLRRPNAGEATTAFYDLPLLRSAKELVLSLPRVGFFSTPAFFANWPTNASNQMRVTMNQTLIVATGSSVDGADPTFAPGVPGLDPAHAEGEGCIGCHASLDPTRSIFSATWSWNYHDQLDLAWSAQPGEFAFRDVIQPVSSVAEFGRVLAQHPLVAPGWVQKLCYYANSSPCDENDPEFSRLVDLFRSSNFSWNALVRALFTSPIITHAADTRTRQTGGEVIAVSRRDHLCAALGARLGLPDVCALDATSQGADERSTRDVVSGLPSDAYGRGATAPVLPNRPTPFFLAGVEAICEKVASLVIDAPAGSRPEGAKQWSSAEADHAIAEFVSDVMALVASDSRALPSKILLTSHFTSALEQSGVTATEALRSTFVVACLAPSSLSIGL